LWCSLFFHASPNALEGAPNQRGCGTPASGHGPRSLITASEAVRINSFIIPKHPISHSVPIAPLRKNKVISSALTSAPCRRYHQCHRRLHPHLPELTINIITLHCCSRISDAFCCWFFSYLSSSAFKFGDWRSFFLRPS